ncbi:MAG: hypothetical protein A4E45_01055 [Methanosaeta sp. PtaB.Bin039]|nr:MAG: hypothetical protein A4E45_01055 [Methanosaeta sp. PtaB.Bin039]
MLGNSSQNSYRSPNYEKCRQIDESKKAFVKSLMPLGNSPESKFDPSEPGKKSPYTFYCGSPKRISLNEAIKKARAKKKERLGLD